LCRDGKIHFDARRIIEAAGNLGETVVILQIRGYPNVRHVQDASGTTSYTYNSLDRLTTKAIPEGTLTYTYDAAGTSVWLLQILDAYSTIISQHIGPIPATVLEKG
jgi:YD repeat-containing protein